MTRSALLLFTVVAAVPAQPARFLNFESPLVHPLRVSADGTRLFAAHTADNRLVVYSLADPSHPLLLTEIPVGLEPVSVNPRTDDEVWVVNHLSDSVSIVSVSAGYVVDTLPVKDEPADVAFAGGRAFVSAAASDEVRVFDVATHAPVATIPIFGKDPRALAVNPAGTRVYVLVARSGNGTTLIRAANAPAPPPPSNPALPPAPHTGLIVAATDPAWAAEIPYSLPDNDVAEIDVAALTVTRYFSGVGTTNTDIAVVPSTGDLVIANTDARNLVRFEPNLRAHAIDSRLTTVTTGATPAVIPFDLNPTINYALLPNDPARALALAEPTGVVIDDPAGLAYVAAQGTDRVGVVAPGGNVIARIEIGTTPGSASNPLAKRGPRALALHPSAPRLYVLNKLSASVSVVDTGARAVVGEFPLGSYDPTPAAIRDGRKFLYDAKLSGNGTMSCAACHVDGDTDGLSWDLGDPGGTLAPPPSQPAPFNAALSTYHPMKGPMMTQTLKGLSGTSPLHWRGDRADFQAFNPAFSSLMGGSPLSAADLGLFAAFGTSITFPPNPNQPRNRSYLTTPAGTNQQAGFDAFTAIVVNHPVLGAIGCVSCHAPPTSTNRLVIAASVLLGPQQQKVPSLRNLYRKQGFLRSPGPQKAGFGFTHDGALDTLASFLATPIFNPWPSSTKDDIVEFLLAFDTGTAPAVGHQVTVTAANAASLAVASDLALLTARAQAGDIDLVVKGQIGDVRGGLLYAVSTQQFIASASNSGPFTLATLLAFAQTGYAVLTFTGVPPGTGQRIGLDRDLDGTLDGLEGVSPYGAATAGCSGSPRIDVNSEPRVGNGAFAITGSNLPANAPGLLALGIAPASTPLGGITVLIDLRLGPPLILPVTADASGWCFLPIPLPPLPSLAGVQAFVQFAVADPCGPQGLSASQGLHLTIQQQ